MRYFKTILLFVLVFISCNNQKNNDLKNNIIYYCDAENATADKKQFITHGDKFGGAKSRNSEDAYKGNYSCKLDQRIKYGMEKKIYDVVPGELIKVSVFRKSSIDNSKGFLVVSTSNLEDDQKIYQSRNKSFGEKDENGWEHIAFDVQIPKKGIKISVLKVYVYLADQEGETVYFDDLLIERDFSRLSSKKYGKEAISIQMADVHYNKLFAMRDTAFLQGVISSNLKKFVPGILSYKGEKFPIEIRLKGDWTDHIIGGKWSFRIKLRQSQSLMGLKQFSLQSPATRSFLNEWIIHEMCHDEDILSTRYEFHPLIINGMSFGIYALEEHFTKQLIESKKRREGPILKFDENGLWERELYYKKNNKYLNKPFFEASKILPFQKGKTIRTPNLKNQFLIAQNLMLKYKNGDSDFTSYLDLDRLAKAYAIMTIGNVKHAFTWHNQRFYYNPVLSKLELIVYDCYPNATQQKTDPKIFGNWEEGTHFVKPSEYATLAVFNDLNFNQTYLYYLKKFTANSYYQNFLSSKKDKIDSIQTLISQDYLGYKFNNESFWSNIEKVKTMIPEYEEKINKETIRFSRENKVYNEKTDTVFPSVSLVAHLEQSYPDGTAQISLTNYHTKSIIVCGYSTKEDRDSIVVLNSQFSMLPSISKDVKYIFDKNPYKIFYKENNQSNKTTHSCLVSNWNKPVLKSELYNLMTTKLDSNCDFLKIDSSQVTFLKGRHFVERSIIIPKNMNVVFEPGTELIFDNETFFISYSSIDMQGTLENPIKITSLDNTANGFTIFQAPERSVLKHVVFDGLNTLDLYGWTLTGAVSFYESDVDISYCEFNNNVCEDGLNVIRSDFNFVNSTMTNTAFDAIDGDFCTGEISDSKFYTLGNDCLDFSGSYMKIKNCQINSAGDKGISCGEASTLNVSDIKIDGAHTGAASKDHSKLFINNIDINNCKIAFSSFEKKSEYGPGYMEVKNYKINNTPVESNSIDGSKILLK